MNSERKHIVFLHGALADGSQLDAFASLFEKTHHVHVLTFGGHGLSDIPKYGFTIEGFCEEVIEYMNAEKIGVADFFGYSMGGYIALYLASRMPGKVGKVVTLATKLAWDQETAERETVMLDPVRLKEKVPAYADKLQMLHSGSGWEVLLGCTANLMRSLGKHPLNGSDWQRVAAPVLMMVGDKDKMVSSAETESVASLLASGSFVILPETPHPFEQVDVHQLAQRVAAFLT